MQCYEKVFKGYFKNYRILSGKIKGEKADKVMNLIRTTIQIGCKAAKAPKKVIELIKSPKRLVNYFFYRYNIRCQIPNLEHIVLYVTSVCNMKCLMCDVGQKANRGIDRLRRSEKKEMELNLLNKILNDPYLKKKRISFNLLMTEPLLHSRIGKVVREIKENGHKVNITTNGFLLAEQANELVDNGLDSLQVSIDGPREVHDKIRRVNVYQRAIEGIRIINKLKPGLPVTINCAVTNLNFNCLYRLVRILENENLIINQLKFEYMAFISGKMLEKHNNAHIQGITQIESTISEHVSPDKVDILTLHKELKQIKKMKKNNIKNISIIPNIISKEGLGKYFSLNGEKLAYYNYCVYPFEQIAIKTDGAVLFHMRCFDYYIGNIIKNNLKDIFYSDSAKYFRRKFKEFNFCFPVCTRCCGVVFR